MYRCPGKACLAWGGGTPQDFDINISNKLIGRSVKSREARECTECNVATVLLLAFNGGIYQHENNADWLGDLLLL
jgi:hypothetical protein